jgi:hypothetical protein
VLRRNHPDLSGEFVGDALEDFEARRFNAVVIGYEYAIQHNAAPI